MIAALLVAVFGATLPAESDTPAASFPWFPDTVHAFVWRNWTLVPAERMAAVLDTSAENVLALGKSMGLPDPPAMTDAQQRRWYITVIRRNWHLLPHEQMQELLGWSAEKLAFTLREDDFLFVKLGLIKPKCAPLVYAPPTEAAKARAAEIAAVVREHFPEGLEGGEPPLAFIDALSAPYTPRGEKRESRFAPRYCYSYFALYGDPLLEPELDPYPDGYLARLADAGVDGVWMQAVLYTLAPFPWNPALSDRYEERLSALRDLAAKCKKHGIGIYLYLNEPRAMPVGFYEQYPDVKGVTEGDYAAMCTSAPEVRTFITDAVAGICTAVPDIAGIFTISGSENLTNCWSHYMGDQCVRCRERTPAAVIGELHGAIQEGIDRAGAETRLIAWDWGWKDEWAVDTIDALPAKAAHMSVSEWSLPITRGGVANSVGEYSISAVGPGPRATRHWEAAQARGLKTLAKIQAGTTWEIGSMPYVPAVANVARHAANLRNTGVEGLMLGWTLGGYPSPNLEVVAEIGAGPDVTVEQAMTRVAARRFGEAAAPAVVAMWQSMSTAFSEFPYNGAVVYNAPQHMGPANTLWLEPTGFRATMVGLPYDDLDGWRGNYPPDVLAGQFEKVADGFDAALAAFRAEADRADLTPEQGETLDAELRVAEAVAIHYRSAANQTRFVAMRNGDAPNADALRALTEIETDLAKRLHALQRADSRLGYEATNHYFYVPMDLAEKVVNCAYLADALR